MRAPTACSHESNNSILHCAAHPFSRTVLAYHTGSEGSILLERGDKSGASGSGEPLSLDDVVSELRQHLGQQQPATAGCTSASGAKIGWAQDRQPTFPRLGSRTPEMQ